MVKRIELWTYNSTNSIIQPFLHPPPPPIPKCDKWKWNFLVSGIEFPSKKFLPLKRKKLIKRTSVKSDTLYTHSKSKSNTSEREAEFNIWRLSFVTTNRKKHEANMIFIAFNEKIMQPFYRECIRSVKFNKLSPKLCLNCIIEWYSEM